MFRTLLLLSSLCSGCGYSTSYPPTWPEVETELVGNDCPDISGTYKELGHEAQEGKGASSLSSIFWEDEMDPEGLVVFSRPDTQTIVVEGAYDGNPYRQRTLTLDGDDFSCHDGKIWVSDAFFAAAVMIMAVVGGKETFGFAKTDDGSLLAEYQSSAVGVYVLIPVIERIHSFILWPAAE